MKFIPFTSLLMILSALPALAQDASDVYSKLFPYSAEICMGTQTRYIGHAEGAITGHSTLYIHGACVDRNYKYPQLKLCDPSKGAGVSVNIALKNVNWIAVEGRDFFFYGNQPDEKPFDQRAYENVISKAIAAGTYSDIQAQSKYSRDPEANPDKLPDESFFPRFAFGSDFAMALTRNVYCSRIPLSRAEIATAIDKLNRLNRHYSAEGNAYNWDLFKNNCAHLTHNVLAAAGFWESLMTEAALPVELLNIAVPLNEVVDAEVRGNDLPLENPRALYNDPIVRKAVLEGKRISTRPGVLFEALPQHLLGNSVYAESPQMGFMLDMPIFAPAKQKMNQILFENRYVQLKANLINFKQRYERAIKNRKPIEDWVESHDENWGIPSAEPEFESFYSKYYEYLERELEFVNSALKQVQ